MSRYFFLPVVILILCCTTTGARVGEPLRKLENDPVSQLKLPPGFRISLFAKVPGARSIARAPDGTLFIGSGAFSNPYDRVYRIKDWNQNGKIDEAEVEILIDGLNNPNGVAVRGTTLFVAEIDGVLAFDKVLQLKRGSRLTRKQARKLPYTFPDEDHHGWKFIRFAPPPNDRWLYVPVGAPCNICKPPSPEFSAIHRIDVDGRTKETVAKGVRNTVGFDFHPTTGNLWFTDNGRDSLGDDRPPDELNEVTAVGQHFGYPYCHGSGMVDPKIRFDEVVGKCSATQATRANLGAHVAALGMRFYRGSKFPKSYQDRIFIAEHGSWNRTRKSGYRVTTVKMVGDRAVYEPFVTGWLNEQTQKAWGRPVDIESMPDGSLLVSDDGLANSPNTGALYRIEFVDQD